jgi:hypothetical protein
MPALNGTGIVTILGVTGRPVAMEQLFKHVSADMNSRNSMRAVFPVRSVRRAYKREKEDLLSQSSFETPSCQDMSLEAEELN